MNMITKNNIYKEHLDKWLKAVKENNKKEKSRIIDHICFVTAVHSKSVSRSFKRLQLRGKDAEEKRGRKKYYTPDAVAALKSVWDIAGEPCGENLHGVVSDYVRILQRDNDWKHSPQA